MTNGHPDLGDLLRAASSSKGGAVTALFAGTPGETKTNAARVVAKELGRPLYRVDLGKVVGKFIGETEKNIDRLLDKADETGAVLFFDEADALFGKRSGVKDAHDKYANQEVSYLLQRVEETGATLILAIRGTNGLDAALLRRFRFVLED